MSKKEEECKHEEAAPCAYFTNDNRHFLMLYCGDCDLYFQLEGTQLEID